MRLPQNLKPICLKDWTGWPTNNVVSSLILSLKSESITAIIFLNGVADEDHQNCLVNQAKRKGGKLVAKKKYCRPSDKSKKETGTYVREELRRLIGKEID